MGNSYIITHTPPQNKSKLTNGNDLVKEDFELIGKYFGDHFVNNIAQGNWSTLEALLLLGMKVKKVWKPFGIMHGRRRIPQHESLFG